MKTAILLLGACVWWIVGATTLAGDHPRAEHPTSPVSEMMGTQQTMMAEEEPREHATLRASELIGFKVRNDKGEFLGQITDLVIDAKKGHIAYAVLSHGGVIGFGGKLFAIPFDKLDLDAQGKSAVLDLSPSRLQAMPGLPKGTLPESAEEQWNQLKSMRPEMPDISVPEVESQDRTMYEEWFYENK